jgi:UDP-N-acetylmuramyl pentapeptide synthase
MQGVGHAAVTAQAARDHDELLTRLKTDATHESCVLVMGKRDRSLPALVKILWKCSAGEQ